MVISMQTAARLLKTLGSVAITVVVMAALSACAGGDVDAAVEEDLVRDLGGASQCGFHGRRLVYMDSRARLKALAETRGMSIPAPGNHDFSRTHLLLVAAGRKPTGGYGVTLEDSRIRDGELQITVEVRSPSADQMVTQALTSPCALLAVTAEGWSRVRVSGPGFDELSVSR